MSANITYISNAQPSYMFYKWSAHSLSVYDASLLFSYAIKRRNRSSGAKGARTGAGIKQYRVISDYTANDAVLAPLRMVKVGRYALVHTYNAFLYIACMLANFTSYRLLQ
jgi:hypothetical protein